MPTQSELNISVVAANYNNGPFLKDFFESWADSSHKPKEIIFVDDGSTDNSLEIASTFADILPELRIVKLEKNTGFANALNTGIQLAQCKYILRIDPDDMVMPSRLISQFTILEDSKADVVGSNAIIFNSSSGKDICRTNFPLDHPNIEKTIHRGEHGCLHPTVMARAELFKNNPYIQEHVPAEDYDIFARMLKSGAIFANIEEPLLRYRIHQRSASNILPVSTIIKTYKIRDEIFGTTTSALSVRLYYLHIKSYRKYLFSQNALLKPLYALGASIFRPDKAARRIVTYIKMLKLQ